MSWLRELLIGGDSDPQEIPDSKDGDTGSTVIDSKGHSTHYNQYGKADEFEGEC